MVTLKKDKIKINPEKRCLELILPSLYRKLTSQVVQLFMLYSDACANFSSHIPSEHYGCGGCRL
jgi:hypothetical protein